jgi:hypothetical protein
MSAELDKDQARYVTVLRGGVKGKPSETRMTIAELRAVIIKKEKPPESNEIRR